MKWDKCGVIVSVEPYDKYTVKILGSRRLTNRNRQQLQTACSNTTIEMNPEHTSVILVRNMEHNSTQIHSVNRK